MRAKIILPLAFIGLAGCTTGHHINLAAAGPKHKMLASYYGGGERLNHHTANGDVFDPHKLRAASYRYPMGSRLRVCRAKCVDVKVNDLGPAHWTGRGIDLTLAAARHIGLVPLGVGVVTVENLN